MGKDGEGKRKRKFVTFHGSKRKAEARMREILNEMDKGIPIDKPDLTVAQHLDKWLNYKAQYLSEKTAHDYAGIARRYLKPVLGHIPLILLKPDHVSELHKQMRQKGLSSRSIQYAHRVLSQAMKDAVKWEILGRNVCNSIKAPGPQRKNLKTLDREGITKLLEASKDTSDYPLTFLAVYTGMRRSELLGLRWKDIDLQQGKLNVNQVIVRVTGKKLKPKAPKTKYSRRLIILPASAVKLLIDIKLKSKKFRESAGLEWDENALIFSNVDGDPICPDAVIRRFKEVAKTAGFPSLRFHDLRHTHASLLLDQGVPIKAISERLGHASIQITLDTYSHLTEDFQQATAEAFEIAMNPKETIEIVETKAVANMAEKV